MISSSHRQLRAVFNTIKTFLAKTIIYIQIMNRRLDGNRYDKITCIS